jgi:DnaJ-domain-containing protein 1
MNHGIAIISEIVCNTEPKLNGDIDRAMELCKQRFEEIPNYECPDDRRLETWIQTFFNNLLGNLSLENKRLKKHIQDLRKQLDSCQRTLRTQWKESADYLPYSDYER